MNIVNVANIWLIDVACFLLLLLFLYLGFREAFHSAIQRDVGPKALTALLLLFREHENTLVMNVIKERTLYLNPDTYQ